MDNNKILQTQLQLRDAKKYVSDITLTLTKKRKEVEQLESNLIDANQAVQELEKLLDGKVYRNNTGAM